MLFIKYVYLWVHIFNSTVRMLTLQCSYFSTSVVTFQVFTFVDARTKYMAIWWKKK